MTIDKTSKISHAGGSPMKRFLGTALALLALSCNEPVGQPRTQPEMQPQIKVTIYPKKMDLVVSATQQFSARVTGASSDAVDWYVNDVRSGYPVVGTIDTSGAYTAPDAVPNPAAITVKAVSRADTTKSDAATVTIVGPTDQPLLVWSTFFAPSSPADDGYLWGVLIDGEQNVVAAGHVRRRNGSVYDSRATALSTDRFGRPRWTFALDRTSAAAGSIVLGADRRSVFVVGQVGYSGDGDQLPILFALDSTGQEALERTCSNIVNGAFGNASRDANRLYLVTWPTAILTSDLAGNLDCTGSIDPAVGDLPGPRVVQVTPFREALLVAGDRSMSNSCVQGGHYSFVQKINGSSQPIWRFDFESTIGSTNSAASVPRLAVAEEAGQWVIYVTLAWVRGCASNANDALRYLTAKLDAQGNLIWSDLWNGDNSPTSCEAFPYAILPDPRGGVVIAGMGSTDCLTAWDCAVASYAADGSRRWTMKPVFKGNGNNACSAATITGDGRFLYLVGQTGPIFRGPQELFVARYALPQ